MRAAVFAAVRGIAVNRLANGSLNSVGVTGSGLAVSQHVVEGPIEPRLALEDRNQLVSLPRTECRHELVAVLLLVGLMSVAIAAGSA